MTTGLSYDGSVAGTNSYIQQIAKLAVVEENDANFLVILPQMITYAENRIYRDLDFLFTSVANTAYTTSNTTRNVVVPQGTFVVPEQINIITPAGETDPDQGNRITLLPTTKEYLDAVWGNSQVKGVPVLFAPFDDYTFLLGPYPDDTYTCEIVGTIRPNSMSATNPTTFISLYLPDLFIMASMIYISGYQRNFGRLNDDPQMAVTYESQYQTLLRGAKDEENRKKFEAAAWSSQSQSTSATPTR